MTARDDPAPLASPPCYAHELEFDGEGFAVVDEEQRRDVARWRTSERKRLIADRLAIPAAQRTAWSGDIARHIREALGSLDGRTIGLYWPIRGEPDLRPLFAAIASAGGTLALPVVVEKARPLEFWRHTPGEPLDRGVWNIPVPHQRRPVDPDTVVAPLVGFDPDGFRLGYGGGYFDRTLAARHPRPRAIGVGYCCQRLKTIFPQPHDVPMNLILTENGAEPRS